MAAGVRARGCLLRMHALHAPPPRASPARLAPSQRHQVWPRDARQPHRVHPRVAAAHREVGVQRARARAGNTRGEAHARAEEAGGVGGRGLGRWGPNPPLMQARSCRVSRRVKRGDSPAKAPPPPPPPATAANSEAARKDARPLYTSSHDARPHHRPYHSRCCPRLCARVSPCISLPPFPSHSGDLPPLPRLSRSGSRLRDPRRERAQPCRHRQHLAKGGCVLHGQVCGRADVWRLCDGCYPPQRGT